MKYAIDRIEGNIAILEDITNNKKIEVDTKELPPDIKDGSIVIFENNVYSLDLETESERRKRIMAKFNRLKK